MAPPPYPDEAIEIVDDSEPEREAERAAFRAKRRAGRRTKRETEEREAYRQRQQCAPRTSDASTVSLVSNEAAPAVIVAVPVDVEGGPETDLSATFDDLDNSSFDASHLVASSSKLLSLPPLPVESTSSLSAKAKTSPYFVSSTPDPATPECVFKGIEMRKLKSCVCCGEDWSQGRKLSRAKWAHIISCSPSTPHAEIINLIRDYLDRLKRGKKPRPSLLEQRMFAATRGETVSPARSSKAAWEDEDGDFVLEVEPTELWKTKKVEAMTKSMDTGKGKGKARAPSEMSEMSLPTRPPSPRNQQPIVLEYDNEDVVLDVDRIVETAARSKIKGKGKATASSLSRIATVPLSSPEQLPTKPVARPRRSSSSELLGISLERPMTVPAAPILPKPMALSSHLSGNSFANYAYVQDRPSPPVVDHSNSLVARALSARLERTAAEKTAVKSKSARTSASPGGDSSSKPANAPKRLKPSKPMIPGMMVPEKDLRKVKHCLCCNEDWSTGRKAAKSKWVHMYNCSLQPATALSLDNLIDTIITYVASLAPLNVTDQNATLFQSLTAAKKRRKSSAKTVSSLVTGEEGREKIRQKLEEESERWKDDNTEDGGFALMPSTQTFSKSDLGSKFAVRPEGRSNSSDEEESGEEDGSVGEEASEEGDASNSRNDPGQLSSSRPSLWDLAMDPAASQLDMAGHLRILRTSFPRPLRSSTPISIFSTPSPSQSAFPDPIDIPLTPDIRVHSSSASRALSAPNNPRGGRLSSSEASGGTESDEDSSISPGRNERQRARDATVEGGDGGSLRVRRESRSSIICIDDDDEDNSIAYQRYPERPRHDTNIMAIDDSPITNFIHSPLHDATQSSTLSSSLPLGLSNIRPTSSRPRINASSYARAVSPANEVWDVEEDEDGQGVLEWREATQGLSDNDVEDDNDLIIIESEQQPAFEDIDGDSDDAGEGVLIWENIPEEGDEETWPLPMDWDDSQTIPSPLRRYPSSSLPVPTTTSKRKSTHCRRIAVTHSPSMSFQHPTTNPIDLSLLISSSVSTSCSTSFSDVPLASRLRKKKVKRAEATPSESSEMEVKLEALEVTFRRMIVEDQDLWLRVLRYEPIDFRELVSVANEHRASGRGWQAMLKKWLDGQSITYFTEEQTGPRSRH